MKRKQLPEKVKRRNRARKPSLAEIVDNALQQYSLRQLGEALHGTPLRPRKPDVELPPAPVPVERVENKEQREARLLRASIVFDDFMMRYGTKKQ